MLTKVFDDNYQGTGLTTENKTLQSDQEAILCICNAQFIWRNNKF